MLDQGRMRQRPTQVFDVAVGFVIEQHDRACGHFRSQLPHFSRKAILQDKAVGWQVDLVASVAVTEENGVADADAVAEYLAARAPGSLDPLQIGDGPTAGVDVLPLEDLQPLPQSLYRLGQGAR